MAKNQVEVDELQIEVKRVNAVYSQKIQKISKWQSREMKQEGTDLSEARKIKKETLLHSDVQCEILN